MAASLIGGLLQQDNIAATQISVFEPNRERAQSLAKQFGINACASNTESVSYTHLTLPTKA